MLNKFGKLKQDYKIAIKEAKRYGYEKCEYHDECRCDKPELGTFFNQELPICGKCVLLQRSKEYKQWVKDGIKGLMLL